MKNNIFSNGKSNGFTRFFWNACGAEIEVLEKCGNNDHVKYFCLGGIVLGTGVMASFAGGYAFYTIFQPKTYVLTEAIHPLTAFFSVVFGILWGLMIFNLDRYIVASSGIGDGTEKITWNEFRTAVPRLIMGIVIAITISKPVEIRMFKTEIDHALYKTQLDAKKVFTQEVNNRSSSRRSQIDEEMDIYNTRLSKYEEDINKRHEEVEAERLKRGGRGDETNRLENQYNSLIAEKNAYISSNASRIQNLRKQLEDINKDSEGEISKGDEVASQLDGLLQRIKLAHEIAGWPVILFITLLFMVIELTPIFFKMMITKSNYDFMLDEYKKNNLILSGLIPDKLNPNNTNAAKNILREEIIRQLEQKVKLQEEFFNVLYDKYREDIISQANENYKKFVKEKKLVVDLMPNFENMKSNDFKNETNHTDQSSENDTEDFDKNEDFEKESKNDDSETTEKENETIISTGSNFEKEKNSETSNEDSIAEKTNTNHNLDYTGPDFEEIPNK